MTKKKSITTRTKQDKVVSLLNSIDEDLYRAHDRIESAAETFTALKELLRSDIPDGSTIVKWEDYVSHWHGRNKT